MPPCERDNDKRSANVMSIHLCVDNTKYFCNDGDMRKDTALNIRVSTPDLRRWKRSAKAFQMSLSEFTIAALNAIVAAPVTITTSIDETPKVSGRSKR